jgi:hypothetical protein
MEGSLNFRNLCMHDSGYLDIFFNDTARTGSLGAEDPSHNSSHRYKVYASIIISNDFGYLMFTLCS